MTGIVRSFDEHIGLGVVMVGDLDYPFHCTQIADGSRSVDPGAVVAFDLKAGRLGRWEAVDLRG